LNRITQANGLQRTTSGSWISVYGQGFVCDRWGNRTINAGTTWGNAIPNTVFTVNTANNRLNQLGYDSAGNATSDSTAGITQMNYDAENRMTSALKGSWSYYVYDADGKRVRRITGGVETWHIYGFGGELIAEYPLDGAAGSPSKEYGYRGGQLLIVGDMANVRWTVTDSLGTPRIVAGKTGALSDVTRHDYLPFGEELFVNMGTGSIRSTTQGYSTGNTPDGLRKKFAGYERDNETGLDFAGARYYANIQGRFTSPDPLLASGRPDDPSSWNRYAYTRNNPLRFIDPTGLYDWDASAGGIFSDDELRARQRDKSLTKAERNAAKGALQFRAKFRSALAAANQAATSGALNPNQQAAVQESVAAYGTENDLNGVFVGVKPDVKGSKATTLLNEDDTTTIMFNKGLKGDNLVVTLAHEGRHAGDITNWLDSHSSSSVNDINHYYREWRAWDVSSFVGQALGMKNVNAGSNDYQVWNKGWKAVDRETLRSNGVQKILQYSNLKWNDTDFYSTEHKHRP
jgi:RHS repeat-associated protein